MVQRHDQTDELVHLDVVDRIATITLDSPENRNALSRRLMAELGAHLTTAWEDPEVRGVLLTATGTVFCSGADLRDPPGAEPTSGEVTVPELLTNLWGAPKTVVLQLNGHVRAGGIGLVAAADIVVAPRRATFAFSEVRLGVAPAIVAVVCGRRMQPRALARYMLTGASFDAFAARDAGLVTLAVEDDALASTVAGLLDDVRLTEPNAVRVTKNALVRLPALSLTDGLAWAEEVSRERFRSPEAAEGIAAFREKRAPSWAEPAR
jgi:enoyl-CoA hydratase/carnithine racemase